MTDHDPMCQRYEADHWCECALIARVRADERARAYPGREVRSQLIGAYAQLSHAEAVAARLVEVICEDDLWRELLEAKLDRISLMWRAARKERDAARAEVAALREQIAGMYQAETFTDTDGYPSTRVFKAEVVGQNEWAANIRREVLADLRAKVRLIPARAVRMEHEWSNDAGWVPTDKVIDTVPLADVLTLIEEADRD